MEKRKFYTLWIALICVLIFLVQTFMSGFTDLFILDSSSYTEVWRFITSIFLHASVSHLILNLFALILFGLILESIIGSNRFLAVFLVSGLIANLIAVNFYSSSLGASGAIYGILGALTILRPKMTVWLYSLPMPMFIASIVWILIGVFGLFTPSNTGHIAHLLGIAVGLLFGLYFYNNFKERKEITYSVNIPEEHMQRWENEYLRN